MKKNHKLKSTKALKSSQKFNKDIFAPSLKSKINVDDRDQLNILNTLFPKGSQVSDGRIIS